MLNIVLTQKQNIYTTCNIFCCFGVFSGAYHHRPIKLHMLHTRVNFLHSFITNATIKPLALHGYPQAFAFCNNVNTIVATGLRNSCFLASILKFSRNPVFEIMSIIWRFISLLKNTLFLCIPSLDVLTNFFSVMSLRFCK